VYKRQTLAIIDLQCVEIMTST